jgi:hypothetical protein
MTRTDGLLALTVGLFATSVGANSIGAMPTVTRVPKPYSSRALRGLKSQASSSNKVKETGRKNIEAERKTSVAPKKTPSVTKAPVPVPEGRAPKNTDKDSPTNPKERQYDEYNYFVEACQEELLADVINGGIIQHSQYTSFIYGYCRGSDMEGKKCSKDAQDKGFDHLPNDMKLMYIKIFCPTDVEGQMSCLHGINDRGREYEFHEELDRMCQDLEKLMIKNDILRLKPSK